MTASDDEIVGSGPNFNDLGNRISDAIYDFVANRKMGVDEAVCCVIAVAADYGRNAYGDAYLDSMKTVIERRLAQSEGK